jgi:hypothetical protein
MSVSFVFAEMCFESVEAVAPHRAVGLEPCVQLGQRFQPDPVEPALPVGAHVDEAGVAQDAQVLRDERLAAAELIDEVADGPLALPKQVEDPPTVRLRENFDRCKHAS